MEEKQIAIINQLSKFLQLLQPFFFEALDSFLNTQNLFSAMFYTVFRNFIWQLFATFYCKFC